MTRLAPGQRDRIWSLPAAAQLPRGGIGAGRLRWNQQEAHIVERRRWSAVVFRVLVIATVRRKWGELRGTPAYFVRGGVAAMRHGRRRKLDREWRRLGRGQLGLLMQAAHDLLADALLRVREVEGMKGRTSTRYDARTCSRRRRARALDRAIPMRTTEWATIRSGLHQLLFSKGFGNARTTGIAELALTVGLDEGSDGVHRRAQARRMRERSRHRVRRRQTAGRASFDWPTDEL